MNPAGPAPPTGIGRGGTITPGGPYGNSAFEMETGKLSFGRPIVH